MKIEDFKDILYEKDEETGIVTLTINKPKRNNAMSSLTFLEMFWAAEHLEQDDSAYAMIITGAADPEKNDPENESLVAADILMPKHSTVSVMKLKSRSMFRILLKKS